MTSGTLLDSNLLCLLVVGRVSRVSIGTHPRLRAFDDTDFEMLSAVIDRVGDPVLCAHVLAETSNLLGYRQAPAERARWLGSLRDIIGLASEPGIASAPATEDASYIRLGLTDAVILQLTENQALTLLSDDLRLCLEAGRRGLRTINYNYLRDGAMRIDQL